MTRSGALLAFGLMSVVPAPVLACTYPIPAAIKGESEASYNARMQQFIRDWQASGSMAWQRDLFDQAASISLAKVIERREPDTLRVTSILPQDPGPRIFEADLLPIASLKGRLPSSSVTVRWKQDLLCRFNEPGSAARSPAGTLVLLFDEFGPGYFTDAEGFPISMVRDPRLSKALDRIPAALKKGAE